MMSATMHCDFNSSVRSGLCLHIMVFSISISNAPTLSLLIIDSRAVCLGGELSSPRGHYSNARRGTLKQNCETNGLTKGRVV